MLCFLSNQLTLNSNYHNIPTKIYHQQSFIYPVPLNLYFCRFLRENMKERERGYERERVREREREPEDGVS